MSMATLFISNEHLNSNELSSKVASSGAFQIVFVPFNVAFDSLENWLLKDQ